MSVASIDLYPGFRWAMPLAFGSAIEACRFEQGDVLYSDASAYAESGSRAAPARYQIQVLDPPRSARAVGIDGEGHRFFANWESPVIFEFGDRETGERRRISSTQGRLFNCLWQGDTKWLESRPAPPPPQLLRELQGRVAEAIPALLERLRGAKTQQLFAFAHDLASDASRVKAQAILAALETRYATGYCDLSPSEANIAGGEVFRPSLVIRGIGLSTAEESAVEDHLKGVLYGPSARKGQGPDRFALSRHGVLVEAR